MDIKHFDGFDSLKTIIDVDNMNTFKYVVESGQTPARLSTYIGKDGKGKSISSLVHNNTDLNTNGYLHHYLDLSGKSVTIEFDMYRNVNDQGNFGYKYNTFFEGACYHDGVYYAIDSGNKVMLTGDSPFNMTKNDLFNLSALPTITNGSDLKLRIDPHTKKMIIMTATTVHVTSNPVDSESVNNITNSIRSANIKDCVFDGFGKVWVSAYNGLVYTIELLSNNKTDFIIRKSVSSYSGIYTLTSDDLYIYISAGLLGNIFRQLKSNSVVDLEPIISNGVDVLCYNASNYFKKIDNNKVTVNHNGKLYDYMAYDGSINNVFGVSLVNLYASDSNTYLNKNKETVYTTQFNKSAHDIIHVKKENDPISYPLRMSDGQQHYDFASDTTVTGYYIYNSRSCTASIVINANIGNGNAGNFHTQVYSTINGLIQLIDTNTTNNPYYTSAAVSDMGELSAMVSLIDNTGNKSATIYRSTGHYVIGGSFVRGVDVNINHATVQYSGGDKPLFISVHSNNSSPNSGSRVTINRKDDPLGYYEIVRLISPTTRDVIAGGICPEGTNAIVTSSRANVFYFSNDSMETWNEVQCTGLPASITDIHLGHDLSFILAYNYKTNSPPVISFDRGLTFKQISIPAMYVTAHSVNINKDSTKIILSRNDTHYYSKDGGLTFNRINNIPGVSKWGNIAFDATDRWYRKTKEDGKFHFSEDEGQTWFTKENSENALVNAFSYNKKDDDIFSVSLALGEYTLGKYDNVLNTDNYYSTFSSIPFDTIFADVYGPNFDRRKPYYIYPTKDANILYVRSGEMVITDKDFKWLGSINRVADIGHTLSANADGSLVSVLYNNGNVVFFRDYEELTIDRQIRFDQGKGALANCGDRIFACGLPATGTPSAYNISTDRGATWSGIEATGSPTLSNSDYPIHARMNLNSIIVLYSESSPHVSKDGGDTWHEINTLPVSDIIWERCHTSEDGTFMSIFGRDSTNDLFYTATSNDSGDTFQLNEIPITTPMITNVNDMFVTYVGMDVAISLINDRYTLVSRDGGVTFEKVLYDVRATSNPVSLYRDGYIYNVYTDIVADSVGVYRRKYTETVKSDHSHKYVITTERFKTHHGSVANADSYYYAIMNESLIYINKTNYSDCGLVSELLDISSDYNVEMLTMSPVTGSVFAYCVNRFAKTHGVVEILKNNTGYKELFVDYTTEDFGTNIKNNHSFQHCGLDSSYYLCNPVTKKFHKFDLDKGTFTSKTIKNGVFGNHTDLSSGMFVHGTTCLVFARAYVNLPMDLIFDDAYMSSIEDIEMVNGTIYVTDANGGLFTVDPNTGTASTVKDYSDMVDYSGTSFSVASFNNKAAIFDPLDWTVTYDGNKNKMDSVDPSTTNSLNNATNRRQKRLMVIGEYVLFTNYYDDSDRATTNVNNFFAYSNDGIDYVYPSYRNTIERNHSQTLTSYIMGITKRRHLKHQTSGNNTIEARNVSSLFWASAFGIGIRENAFYVGNGINVVYSSNRLFETGGNWLKVKQTLTVDENGKFETTASVNDNNIFTSDETILMNSSGFSGAANDPLSTYPYVISRSQTGNIITYSPSITQNWDYVILHNVTNDYYRRVKLPFDINRSSGVTNTLSLKTCDDFKYMWIISSSLYRSVDGKRWVAFTPVDGVIPQQLELSPDGSKVIYIANKTLYISSDYGNTFTMEMENITPPNDNYNNFGINNNGDYYVCDDTTKSIITKKNGVVKTITDDFVFTSYLKSIAMDGIEKVLFYNSTNTSNTTNNIILVLDDLETVRKSTSPLNTHAADIKVTNGKTIITYMPYNDTTTIFYYNVDDNKTKSVVLVDAKNAHLTKANASPTNEYNILYMNDCFYRGRAYSSKLTNFKFKERSNVVFNDITDLAFADLKFSFAIGANTFDYLDNFVVHNGAYSYGVFDIEEIDYTVSGDWDTNASDLKEGIGNGLGGNLVVGTSSTNPLTVNPIYQVKDNRNKLNISFNAKSKSEFSYDYDKSIVDNTNNTDKRITDITDFVESETLVIKKL